MKKMLFVFSLFALCVMMTGCLKKAEVADNGDTTSVTVTTGSTTTH